MTALAGAFGICAVFWLGMVAIPVAAVLARVGGSTALLVDPVILSIVRATVSQALWSALFAAIIGLPLGLFIARSRSGVARALLGVPFGIPTVVVATAWVGWLGASGGLAWLHWSYSLRAVILSHVFLNAPWIALQVAQACDGVPRAEREAAQTLGAPGFAVFRDVTWPRVSFALGSAVGQVILLCSMSFTLVLVLGGGPPVQTLETALYSRVRYGDLDLSGAAACAFWELLLSLIPWLLLIAARRGRSLPVESAPRPAARAGLTDVAAGILGALFIAPYFLVLSPSALARLADPAVLAELASPLATSLELAVAASAGTLLLVGSALWAARALRDRPGLRAVWESMAALPSGISPLVLGLGVWLAYARWTDPLSGSLPIMILLQIALFSPWIFRLLWPVAQAERRDLVEAARTLGASRGRAFLFAEWPRWRAPVRRSLALVLGASIAEVAAVSLFYGDGKVPLPLLLARWVSRYRFADAQALAALLFLFSALVIVIISEWPEWLARERT